MNQDKHTTDFFRWGAFGAIAAVFFVVYFHRVSPSALAPDIARTFGLSGTVLGVLASSYFYSYSLMQPVVGVLVDKWRPRRVVTVSALLMAGGSLLFAFSSSFSLALVGRVIIGLGAGGVFVPFMWFSWRWFPLEERGFVYALWVVIGNCGAVVAAGPLGAAAGTMGWRTATLGLTVLTVVVAVVVWLVVRDDPAEIGQREPEPEMPSTGQAQSTSWPRIVAQTVSIRAVQCALISLFLSYGSLMAFQGLWGVRFLMDVYGLSRPGASNLIMVLPIGIIVGGLLLSKAFDTRFGRVVYIGGYLIGAIVYAIFAVFLGGLSMFSVSVCIFLVGLTQAVFPFALRVYSQVLPQKHFGTAMGLVNAVPFLGGVVFQPLTGYVFDLFGTAQETLPVISYQYFFLLLAGALVVATVSAFWTRVES